MVAIEILSGIFAVPSTTIEQWLETENLTKKIFRAAFDSVYLQDVVNALKKYVKRDRPFAIAMTDKYNVKKQKFENIVI